MKAVPAERERTGELPMEPEELREVVLRAPFRFDQSIGYWTGEPDLERLDAALASVSPDPVVAREVEHGTVRLRGPSAAVAAQAEALRRALDG